MVAPSSSAPVPVRAKKKSRRARGWLRRLISVRRIVQISVGVALYLAAARFHLSLLLIFLAGSALGIVFGKFFCRWLCPMGAIMETLMGAGGDESGRQKSLYMYFKLGCPIAWAGGLLNRISLFRVRVRADKCTDCGLCDKACYVSQLATSQGHSLHAAGQINASTHYSCSRCLSCVAACPTGALTIGPLARSRVLGKAKKAEA